MANADPLKAADLGLFGGGTPSLMPPALGRGRCCARLNLWGFDPPLIEITLGSQPVLGSRRGGEFSRALAVRG